MGQCAGVTQAPLPQDQNQDQREGRQTPGEGAGTEPQERAAFEAQGAEAAMALGERLKLKSGSVRTWLSAWRREQGKSQAQAKVKAKAVRAKPRATKAKAPAKAKPAANNGAAVATQ
jgi:hypothetical protein